MQKGIVISDIKIKKNDSDRTIVTIYTKDCDENIENMRIAIRER